MKIVLLGPPGAGKGTQAHLLIAHAPKIPYIGTGEIFRTALAAPEDTEFGKLGREAYQLYWGPPNYTLCPDDMTNKLALDFLNQKAWRNIGERRVMSFILDGYPRTEEQAIALDQFLKENNQTLDHVLFIDVNYELCLNRLMTRASCPECGAAYNEDKFFRPKEEGYCDLCHIPLELRNDDKTVEGIKKRIEVYRGNKKMLLGFYETKGLVRVIDGNKTPKEVFVQIYEELSKKR